MIKLSPITAAILFSPRGGSSPPASGVFPVLTVRAVDATGARQELTVVDGVTTLTGVAPFFVEFLGYGSYSSDEACNTPDKGFWNLGFRTSFGSAIGGLWSNTLRWRGFDDGLPITAFGYEDVGTHQASLRVVAPSGEATVRVNIVVTDGGAGVTLTPGVLPAFASGTVYNAPAGGTWPDITNQLDGLHNVVIRKTGEGADPYFPLVTLDNRNTADFEMTRSAGIRFHNCDVGNVQFGNAGFDSCAFVGGRVRGLAIPDYNYWADQLIANESSALAASNVRLPRGLLLQDTGQMDDLQGYGYVVVGSGRGIHFRNMRFNKTTVNQHSVRGVFCESSVHDCEFNTTVSSVSYIKLQGNDCTVADTPDPWPDSDMVVTATGTRRRLGLGLRLTVVSASIIGVTGSVQPTTFVSMGPENNVGAEPAQGVELSGFEFNVTAHPSAWYSCDLDGRYLGARANRYNLGDGAIWGVASGTNHPDRVPTSWEGPYFTGSVPAV